LPFEGTGAVITDDAIPAEKEKILAGRGVAVYKVQL
jgi:hypothetical protein